MRAARVPGALAAFAAALLLVGTMSIGAMPARADCTSSCVEYDQGECVKTEEQCTEEPPPPPQYGAIAYGAQSGAYGDANNWDSQQQAEDTAMKNCSAHGDDCQVMVWFNDQCGAVATGDGIDPVWGLGDGEGAAREAAINKCTAAGGSNCTIQDATCSR